MKKFEFVTFSNGVTVINSTPHPINFMEESGEVVVVPSSCIINAKIEEVEVRATNGISFVKSTFVGSEEGQNIIAEILSANPEVVIIGSIIAAQAYPGKVFGMTPCKGFERVAPAEKRMSTTKFATFE